MIFAHELFLPKNGTPATAKFETMKITRGLIYRVEFQFPPGCAGLAHLIVYDGGHQLWPASPGLNFHLDGPVVAFDDLYFKLAAPYELVVWGYNTDDTYDHTVYIRLGLADSDAFMAAFLPTLAYEQTVKLQAEVEAKQAEVRRAEVLAAPFPWLRRK